MRNTLVTMAVMLASLAGLGAGPGVMHPFESGSTFDRTGPIDALVLATLEDLGIEPANLCSDEVFVRRVYLDVIGTLPEPAEVRSFLRDRRPDKRAALIDALLEREEFADYWAMKWCDLLRVKAEFPINLWPNAVQAYHRWIRDAIRENMPYDQFARELLTSSGSNFRVPPVNFYRAVQGHEPADHRRGRGPDVHGRAHRRAGRRTAAPDMAAFFSRVAYKSTAEWKEEIVYLDPAPAEPLEAVFPDGTTVRIPPDEDPRAGLRRLADHAGQSVVRPQHRQPRLVLAAGPRHHPRAGRHPAGQPAVQSRAAGLPGEGTGRAPTTTCGISTG